MPADRTVKISTLPSELRTEDAVELAYADQIARIEESLRRGTSVLVRCDKEVTLMLWLAVRGRLRRNRENPLVTELADGRAFTPAQVAAMANEGEKPERTAPGRMVQQIARGVRSTNENTVVVILHLDVLMSTSAGLSIEARETLPLVYENPTARFLGFCDPSFEIPKAMEDLFTVVVAAGGVPRETLAKLVIQREAKAIHATDFDPWGLYKYVSGYNAVRLRKAMVEIGTRREAPAGRSNAAEVYKLLRSQSTVGAMELPNIRLDTDIAGYAGVKARIMGDLLTLARRRDAEESRADAEEIEKLLPRGIIFHGPPGTGKTLFAKAMATELDASVTVVAGPELIEKWVGSSEANLRKIFTDARASAPAVIVFDEIDSFATQRGGGDDGGNSDVKHSLVNTLLTEMDGFRKNEMVFVVATTNFLKSLDGALMRPGRFELMIEVPAPDPSDRTAITELYNTKLKLGLSREVVAHIVYRTEGLADPEKGLPFTGDHLQGLCRALKRMQMQRPKGEVLTRDDVDAALVRKVGRNVVMSLDEERIVATHEAGHALVGFLYTGAPLPRAIGIVPDGQTGAMGGVEYEASVRPNAQTREDLRARIAMALGGRAAEGVILGTVSVGAAHDLETANQLARAMVEQFAMAPKPSLLTFLRNTRESPNRTQEIEQQIERILNDEYNKVAHILADNKAMLLHLVEVLLRDKRIEARDFERVLGITPGQKVALRNAANARNAVANTPRNAPRG